jgi:LAGLIDADG-like domain
MAFSEDQAALYLAAMIDGEGWVGEPKGVTNRAIRIANTERDLIDAIEECCQVLGLHYLTYPYVAKRENWSPGWMVHITGEDSFRKILAQVPIRSTRKLDRVRRTIDSFRPRVDVKEARRLYYDEGLTQRQVADRLGVGYKRIRLLMRREGMAARQGSDRSASIWASRRANASSDLDC